MTQPIVSKPQREVSHTDILLTDPQKTLIRKSFAIASERPDDLCDYFFRQLYQLDPTLQNTFTQERDEPRRMLISTLKIAVASLDKLELLVPILKLIAVQHKTRGLTRDQYDTFAEALIWSIEMMLLNQFTSDMRKAWAKLYTLMADVMMKSNCRQPNSKIQTSSIN